MQSCPSGYSSAILSTVMRSVSGMMEDPQGPKKHSAQGRVTFGKALNLSAVCSVVLGWGQVG